MKAAAVVLAGAPNSGKLKEASSENYEALILLAGKPLVGWVVDALAESPFVEEIIVVGPKKELAAALGEDWPPKGKVVQAGDTLLDNLKLGGEAAASERLLLVTADLPLLRPEIVDEFLTRAGETGASLCYPIVSKEDTLAMFPEAERIFVRLEEDTFTGGNFLYLEKHILREASQLFEKVIAARKRPWQLVRILGSSFVFSFLFRTLSIAKIEERAKRLGLNARAIPMRQAEVGCDVDKPKDLQLVKRVLEDFNR